MLIYPAIDLYGGKAVRLTRGDYSQMTVYHENPPQVAASFADMGAEWVHLVDLEGAKSGETPNFETVLSIRERSGLKCQVGGGIRSLDILARYLDAGVDRVILGTKAVEDPDFLLEALQRYGERIAVGVDIRDGSVAVRGWQASSGIPAEAFCGRLEELGVKTVISTDISRDGAMAGSNAELYKRLGEIYHGNLIASGGVTDLDDIRRLKEMGLHGAIVGKAWYTGALDLRIAMEVAR